MKYQRGFVGSLGRRPQGPAKSPERINWVIFSVTALVGFTPFLMLPLLMAEYGMTRVAAWHHVSGCITIIWVPVWLVIGVLAGSYAGRR